MKKKTLTRILSICIMLLLTASLAGCGGKDSASSSASAESESAAESVSESVEEQPEEEVEEEPEVTEAPEEEAEEPEVTEAPEEEPEVTEAPEEEPEVTETPEEEAEEAEAAEEETTEETEESETADAGAIADATLASGTISIDGDLFTLGMGFNELPGEWSLKPEDAEKYKEYTLNPRTTSGSAMGVYKEKWGFDYESFHVMLSVMNLSESSIPYLEGTIDYLDIPNINRTEVVPAIILPGGLTPESTEEEFIAAYGEPSHEYLDEATEFRSLSFRDGDVKLDVIWSKGEMSEISMII